MSLCEGDGDGFVGPVRDFELELSVLRGGYILVLLLIVYF